MASTTAATIASQQPITVFRHGFQPQPGFPQFPQFQGQQFRMQPPNFSQRPPFQMHQLPPGSQPSHIPLSMQQGMGPRPLLGQGPGPGPGPRPTGIY